MTYLFLDTNTWIFLANSRDPITDDFQEGHHLKLFQLLTQKIADGSIQIVTNSIIQEEWNRNKDVAFAFVRKLQNKMATDLQHLSNIRKAIKGSFDNEIAAIMDAYNAKVEGKIAINTTHIENVEQLLKAAISTEISMEIKSFSAGWAIEKKAPFIGDKRNSMADAVILFSAIEYMKGLGNDLYGDGIHVMYPKSIFVSANKNDFSSPENPDVIHEHLSPELRTVNMQYFRSLPQALRHIDNTLIAEKEIAEYEYEMSKYFEVNAQYCTICYPGEDHPYSNVVDFGEPFTILNELVRRDDPNQLKLELNYSPPETQKDAPVSSLQIGNCNWCGIDHIRCQYCEEITAVPEKNAQFECDGCGLIYQIEWIHIEKGQYEPSFRIVGSRSAYEEE